MSQITCNVIADLLELFSDEVVSEDTKTLVEDHLRDCETCNEKLALIRHNLKIPAEVNAEPIKKIKRKIKKKNIIISIISVVVVASILLGAFIFLTQYEVAIPFERTHIFSVELNVEDGDIYIHFMDNIESYATMHQVNYDDATMEVYVHFRDTYHTRYFSNRARFNNSIAVRGTEGMSVNLFPNHEELNLNLETHDTLDFEYIRVDTMRVYYSTWPLAQGAVLGEKYLIWERQMD